jgi:signal transduction histidine kinase
VRLLEERLRGMRLAGLEKAAELLHEHEADPGTFLGEDPRGRTLPGYLRAAIAQVVKERDGILEEVRTLHVPPLWVDRHRLLQILLNLLSNARHAMQESGRADPCLTIRVEPGGEGRLRISVADNGVGVAPEHLSRLFSHGFTTKKDGHGFGLHTSAVAAEELGGVLSCASAGRGQGATFTLELPLQRERAGGRERGQDTG